MTSPQGRTTIDEGDPRRAVHVRAFEPKGPDLSALQALRNDQILHGTALWIDEPETLDQTRTWVRRHREGGVVLVADDPPSDAADDDSGEAGGPGAGRSLGFGALGTFRSEPGYRCTMEDSIYVREDARGLGVGGALLDALLAEARARHVHTVVAVIESTNVASIRLHAAAGFRQAGTLRQVGSKFTRWLDVTVMQLILDAEPPPPGPASSDVEP